MEFAIGVVVGAAIFAIVFGVDYYQLELVRSALRLANSRIRYAESRYKYIMDSLARELSGARMAQEPDLKTFKHNVAFSYDHAKKFFSDPLGEVKE